MITSIIKLSAIVALERGNSAMKMGANKGMKRTKNSMHVGLKDKRKRPPVFNVIVDDDKVISRNTGDGSCPEITMHYFESSTSRTT